jgi:hypothetical protein
MTRTSTVEYLKEFDIGWERIFSRFTQIILMMDEFIKNREFNGKDGKDVKVVIDHRNLKMAIIDYFVDIVRIKGFHGIDRVKKQKIYAYTAYWLLRRKPLQVVDNFKDCEFINEIFITYYIMSLSSAAKGISSGEMKKNPSYKDFQDFLFYYLTYRPVTQQSLELMIEAYYCGYDFKKIS